MESKIANILKEAIKGRGFRDAKDCATKCGLGYGLFRKVLGDGHIPRDNKLIEYAEKLGLDKERLVRLGHYERAPKEAKPFIKDLCEIRPIGRVEESLSSDMSDEEERCLRKALNVLEHGDALLSQGMKTTIEAYYRQIEQK